MRKICKIFVIFLVLVLINRLCDAKISDKRLCADPECKEPISLGITQVNYNAADKYVLGFRANVHVKIFSKSAGREQNYWGAEIQGRRGYVPKNLIREMRVLTNKLDYEVPTELGLEETGQESINVVDDNLEEVNETGTVDAQAPEIAPKIEEHPRQGDAEEDKGLFSQIFGGNSIEDNPEEKTEDKSVENLQNNEIQREPAPVTENTEDEEDYDEEEEDYDEDEDDEADESTEESVTESTEKPINIEELKKPEEEEIFQETKILNNFEELPQKKINEAMSEQSVPKEMPNIVEEVKQGVPVEDLSTEKYSEEVTVNSQESEIPVTITTPQEQDYHHYEEDVVTEPSVFENKSEEVIATTEKVPEFKPIPPLDAQSQPPSVLEPQEVEQLPKEIPPEVAQELPPKIEEVDAKEPVNPQSSDQNEIPGQENPLNDAVPDFVAVNQEPLVNVAPEVPQAAVPVLPPLPNFGSSEQIPQTPVPEVTTFPPIHEHIPPFLPVPEVPLKKPEEIPSPEEKVDVPQTSAETEAPVETVTESVGMGSFEEITKQPEIPKEQQSEEVFHQDNLKDAEGFFSGLFNSIKETLNMKMGKDSAKIPPKIDGKDRHTMDKNTECVDEYCYHPQSQELRHPMVSSHFQSPQEHQQPQAESVHEDYETTKSTNMTLDEFVNLLMGRVLGMSSLILYLSVSAGAILIFTFGHYVLVQCSRERQLVYRLNSVERKLMVAYKECGSVKGELMETKEKLTSIQDNSFGSNDMVIALRGELENSQAMRENLQEQVASLEKELENAAEAGLELNRMVSELLSNQSGSDSIISSVEELQKQLNEQQNTILTINASLAEKSRENSELQVSLASQSDKFIEELSEVREQCKKAEEEKEHLEVKLKDLQEQIDAFMKERTSESQDLKEQIQTHQNRYEDVSKALTQSQSRVQVLEDCIKTLKQESGQKGGGGGGNFEEIMNVANLKTQLVAATKEKQMLKEKLEEENDARKLLEDHVKIIREEVEKLRKEYNDAEKERLEAQTRLEVLTSYFKDKETQLQKELSVKEAMWMKSQGETTSTVEKIRSMQDEIQTLKSQNDALRAEIEAQRAAHKAQIGALETRAQESWLAARQAERRLEESRVESSTLRRKLTSFAENGVNSSNNTNNIDSLTDAPSPLHGVENPGSPLLGVMPPPPFLPPPFMPPPPPFMPPGPFIPAEMRLPPLGRLMSPPPPNNRYSPGLVDERDGRFSPSDRGRYTPDRYHDRYPPHRLGSPYETETDVSPPPTPPPHPRGGYRGYSAYSPPPPHLQSQHEERAKQFKGGLSSGSADSLGPRKSSGNAKV